jgi:hypothetical protein
MEASCIVILIQSGNPLHQYHGEDGRCFSKWQDFSSLSVASFVPFIAPFEVNLSTLEPITGVLEQPSDKTVRYFLWRL